MSGRSLNSRSFVMVQRFSWSSLPIRMRLRSCARTCTCRVRTGGDGAGPLGHMAREPESLRAAAEPSRVAPLTVWPTNLKPTWTLQALDHSSDCFVMSLRLFRMAMESRKRSTTTTFVHVRGHGSIEPFGRVGARLVKLRPLHPKDIEDLHSPRAVTQHGGVFRIVGCPLLRMRRPPNILGRPAAELR